MRDFLPSSARLEPGGVPSPVESKRERHSHSHTSPHPHPRCPHSPPTRSLPSLLSPAPAPAPQVEPADEPLPPSERAAVTTGFRESPHRATGLILAEALSGGTHQNPQEGAHGFTEAGAPRQLLPAARSSAEGPGSPMGSIVLVASQGSDGDGAVPSATLTVSYSGHSGPVLSQAQALASGTLLGGNGTKTEWEGA